MPERNPLRCPIGEPKGGYKRVIFGCIWTSFWGTFWDPFWHTFGTLLGAQNARPKAPERIYFCTPSRREKSMIPLWESGHFALLGPKKDIRKGTQNMRFRLPFGSPFWHAFGNTKYMLLDTFSRRRRRRENFTFLGPQKAKSLRKSMEFLTWS